MMQRTIQTILLVVIMAIAAVIAWNKWKPKSKGPVAIAEAGKGPEFTGPSPFDGLGMRYDGHYRCVRGNIRYLIRFYPEGRAVLVNGTKDVEAQLPGFLTRETQGNPSMGLYNVMVDVRDDSLFFTTRPMKGEISYKGRLMEPQTLRMHRHSHITGVDYDMTYVFVQDSTASAQ